MAEPMRCLGPICLALLAACSAPPANSAVATDISVAAETRHPVSGLPVIPLRIVNGERSHVIQAELASSAAEQARGLMFRTEMGDDEGMLFVRETPWWARFWMKNTVIPLDIVFIGTDRRVINIEADAEPYSLDPRESEGPVSAVLELNGGRAAELGIVPGTRVEW